MIEMKRASPAHQEAVLSLWQGEFGDDAGFVDDFIRWCGWEQLLLLWEDGVPCALTAAPLMELALPGGVTARGGYIYAHTTAQDRRGQGFGRLLLKYADFCLQNQGLDCALVVPAQPSLFDYFASAGYAPAFHLRERRVRAEELAPGGKIRPLSPTKYSALRAGLLSGRPHALSPKGMLGQQELLCAAAGCGLWELETGGGPACAAPERLEDGSVLLREFLAPAGEENAALCSLHGALMAPAYTLRLPPWAGEGEKRAFGALKWYDREKAALWGESEGYFGLALD